MIIPGNALKLAHFFLLESHIVGASLPLDGVGISLLRRVYSVQ